MTDHDEVVLKRHGLQLILVEVGDDRLSEHNGTSKRLRHCNDDVCPVVQVVVLPWPILNILDTQQTLKPVQALQNLA